MIFEEEPKKRSENTKKNKDFFFNTTSPGLSSLFFSNPKPISQHHTIMKWLYYYNCATSNYYNYYLWMNGKSIVKNYFIAWWAFQKSIWSLFENVVKWVIFKHCALSNKNYLLQKSIFRKPISKFDEVNYEHCSSKKVHSGISDFGAGAVLGRKKYFDRMPNPTFGSLQCFLPLPPLEVKKATLASL